ncbi:hypothetical protein ACJX0J_036440 [Zea mays]
MEEDRLLRSSAAVIDIGTANLFELLIKVVENNKAIADLADENSGVGFINEMTLFRVWKKKVERFLYSVSEKEPNGLGVVCTATRLMLYQSEFNRRGFNPF